MAGLGIASPDSRRLGKYHVAAILVVFAVSLAVYINTLWNGFVYDDIWQVVKNSRIRSASFIPEIISSDVWSITGGGQSNYYRPVMYLVYMGVYALAGLNPAAFHFLNALLNSLVCVVGYLVFEQLLRQFTPSGRGTVLPAIAAALIFAVHPVHTEAVAWIAGLPELTYTLFCITAFYFHIKAEAGVQRARFLSVAAYLIALFCKEPAILLPLILLAYDHCRGDSVRGTVAGLKKYIPYLIAAGLYLLVRAAAIGNPIQVVSHHHLGILHLLLNIAHLFSAYVQKMFFPVALNAYTVYTPIFSPDSFRPALSILICLTFTSALVVSFKKRDPVFLCLILFAVPLLPALYIPALPENIFAERYLYFPTFGLFLLIAFVLARWRPVQQWVKMVTAALLLAVVLTGFIASMDRNMIWKDNVTFYTEVIRKSPQVPMMHVNLGWTYSQMGLQNAALKEYEAALRIKPDLAEAHNNIGILYEQQNLLDIAVKKYEDALAIDPKYAEAHNNLGNVYLRVERLYDAIQQFQLALRLSPRYAAAHYNLGNAYSRIEAFDKAVPEYESALRFDPDEPDTRNNLGIAYIKLNRFNEAVEQFRKALDSAPNNVAARQNLERAMATR